MTHRMLLHRLSWITKMKSLKLHLEDKGIPKPELWSLGPAALANYADFHGRTGGCAKSANILECCEWKNGTDIMDVVLSSAGIRGWAAVQFAPEKVVEVRAISQDGNGWVEISCGSLSGDVITTVLVGPKFTVGEVRDILASQLEFCEHLLHIVLPDARLLERSDEPKEFLLLLDQGSLNAAIHRVDKPRHA